MVLEKPWSIRVQDGSPLCVAAIVSGDAHITDCADGNRSTLLQPGDIAIIRGELPYILSDDPDTPPQVVVHPGQRCSTVDGGDLRERMALGVRTWGTGLEGSVTILLGVYEDVGAVGKRLLDALPRLLVLPDDTWDSTLVDVLGREIAKPAPGQEVVLDRLLDLLLITVLRAWFDQPEAEAPAWYRAHDDPVVGQAMRLLHEDPSHAWTVATLAENVGISRAALARRFTSKLGVAPMSYLTEWRLALAADFLRDPDLTLDAVARRVGYGGGFALSSAFKRVRGISPQAHRESGSATVQA